VSNCKKEDRPTPTAPEQLIRSDNSQKRLAIYKYTDTGDSRPLTFLLLEWGLLVLRFWRRSSRVMTEIALWTLGLSWNGASPVLAPVVS
jgi:hypothetical protein